MEKESLNRGLFNRPDFQEMYAKTFNAIKKDFELMLEKNSANEDKYSDRLSEISSFADEDEDFAQSGPLKLKYHGQETIVPREILEIDNLHELFTLEMLRKHLNADEQLRLANLLPKDIGMEPKDIIEDLLTGKIFHFKNPFTDFMLRLKNGCFTNSFQKQVKIEHKIYETLIAEYFQETQKHLSKSVPRHLSSLKSTEFKPMLMKRKLNILRDFEEGLSSDEDSFSSLSDVPRERGFDNLTPGYTTEDSNVEDQADQQIELSIPTPPPAERPRQKRRPPEEGGSKKNDPDKDGKGAKGQKNVLTIKVCMNVTTS
eukprot:TRINITY_DN14366_c0_g2_i1.p1 TRINITY_DN14366_c0_g2~~TRINITY_DN14366_c0_g2_i1.p1  ORF type:complete len:315 (-),score=63.28 TRINITY_DN14366_c0_g2_i1:147-1091(-)